MCSLNSEELKCLFNTRVFGSLILKCHGLSFIFVNVPSLVPLISTLDNGVCNTLPPNGSCRLPNFRSISRHAGEVLCTLAKASSDDILNQSTAHILLTGTPCHLYVDSYSDRNQNSIFRSLTPLSTGSKTIPHYYCVCPHMHILIKRFLKKNWPLAPVLFLKCYCISCRKVNNAFIV